MAHLDDPKLPPAFSRAMARAAGMSDRQITRRLATGAWIPVRHGWMKLSEAASQREPLADLATAVAPAHRRFENSWAVQAFLISNRQRDLVASHRSAALLHGLPRPLDGWGRPTATSATGWGRVQGGGHVLVAPLDDEDIVRLRGVPATSLARTVADCMRTLEPHEAVAIADAALRQGLLASDLASCVQRQQGWPGVVQAVEVSSVASGRRETVLESWSAWSFHVNDLPQPEWQVNLISRFGAWCGRVDCWWEAGLAGEADGRSKYRLAAAERAGSNAARLGEVLDVEREREMDIRRTGAELERWGARDVLNQRRARELTDYLRTRVRSCATAHAFTGRISLA